MAERKPAPLILLISAPSGAGKTTLCDGLLAACPDLVRAVTCTTRAPRPGELQGRDYYFLTKEDFKQRVTAGEFLEHASVYDNHYGLLKGELLAKLHAGKDVLLNVDVQGAASIRMAAALEPELKAALVTLFLTTESLELLAHRLNKRNADDPAVIAKRLAAAKQENAHWRHYDYLVFSTTKEADLQQARTIIAAEKMRSTRAVPPVF
ncbi:MAG TPA: guanylate kinase [Verrucomicrobiae bacterium]